MELESWIHLEQLFGKIWSIVGGGTVKDGPLQILSSFVMSELMHKYAMYGNRQESTTIWWFFLFSKRGWIEWFVLNAIRG